MAYGGTPIIKVWRDGFSIEAPDFDADGETYVIDLYKLDITIPISYISFYVERTAGSTALIDFDVDGSIDGTLYTELGGVTAKDTEVKDAVDHSYRYIKLDCVTVGAGNTLTCHITGR